MKTAARGKPGQRILQGFSLLCALAGVFAIVDACRVDGEWVVGASEPRSTRRFVPHSDLLPRTVRVRVRSVSGAPGLRVGDLCEFDVERWPRQDGYYCNAQVWCGGRLLYGGPDRGFFDCEVFEQPRRDVVGADEQTARRDRDGALSLNTRDGKLRLWDDASGVHGAFDVRADVLSVE